MTTPPITTIGLRTGLTILALVCIGTFAALTLITVPPSPSTQVKSPASIAAALPDTVTAGYLRKLRRTSPETAEKLQQELQAAIRSGEAAPELADRVTRAALSEFKPNAPYILRASTGNYDRLLDHVRTGFEMMSESGSHWCEAVAVEGLLKLSVDDLIETLIDQFEYDSGGYRWALTWSGFYLDAAYQGQKLPHFHGQRSLQDKLALQEQGLAIGSREWALALQVAAFSQAEGQGYAPMREVIESIDVCKLGIAMVDLSDRLPEPNRGRIWSELMPEIFYGNTPYVLVVVTDYFFLS